MKKRRVLAFRGTHDRPGRRDVSKAFDPACDNFIDVVGDAEATICVFNNRAHFAERRREVLYWLNDAENDVAFPYDTIGFFTHGWKNGVEFGFTRKTAGQLAAGIWAASGKNPRVVVPLYLCSTGAGANHGAISMADSLRDELCKLGAVHCRVMAHRKLGHTSKNPHAIFMDGMGSPVGGVGGYPVVGARTQLWRRWVRECRSAESTLRFRFPFMTLGAIHRELLAD